FFLPPRRKDAQEMGKVKCSSKPSPVAIHELRTPSPALILSQPHTLSTRLTTAGSRHHQPPTLSPDHSTSTNPLLRTTIRCRLTHQP
ncbi:hypothetical protein U1Q18_006199, partial [Sarracenia purpurea var. burkii]